MNSTLEGTIELLREGLSMPTTEPNDFIQLAICGERVRRSPACDTEPDAIQILVTYEESIRQYSGEVPDGLSVDLDRAISELERYTAHPVLERDANEGEAILRGFDDILAVSRALHIRGNMTDDELANLALKTTNAIEKTLPKLSLLLDYAHWYASTWGVDPEFPELYAFWNTLASGSSTQFAFQRDLARLNRKQHLIDRAVAAFESAAGHHAREITIIDRIRQAIDGWISAFEIHRPAVSAAYFSDEFGKDQSHIVANFDGLTVIQEGASLDILAPASMTLSHVSAVTDHAVPLECTVLSETLVRISLPGGTETKHIHVTVFLDGHELQLPPLKLVNEAP